MNLLVWPRVPSAGTRNPGVLPLCGGVLGGASSQEDAGYGLNQFDVANVAIHDEESAADLVGGASASVLLDFLEHRNPGRKLEFDRRGLKLPWIVMKVSEYTMIVLLLQLLLQLLPLQQKQMLPLLLLRDFFVAAGFKIVAGASSIAELLLFLPLLLSLYLLLLLLLLVLLL